MHKHLTPHTLAAARSFGADRLAVEHLIRTCPTCRQAAQRLERWVEIADHPDLLVAAELDMGQRRLDKLRQVSPEEARRLIAGDDELHRWGVARLALLSAQVKLEESEPEPGEVEEACRLARLAVDVATHLSSELYGPVHCLRIHHEAVEIYLRAQQALATPEDPDRALERLLEQFQAVFSLQLRHLKT